MDLQIAPKKSDTVEGESVTVGESSGGEDMGDMMEEVEVEERERRWRSEKEPVQEHSS